MTGFALPSIYQYTGHIQKDAILIAVSALSRFFINTNDFNRHVKDMTRYNEMSSKLSVDLKKKIEAIEEKYAQEADKLDVAFDQFILSDYSKRFNEDLSNRMVDQADELVTAKTLQQINNEDTKQTDQKIENTLEELDAKVIDFNPDSSVPDLDIENDDNLNETISELVIKQAEKGVETITQKKNNIQQLTEAISNMMRMTNRETFNKTKLENVTILQEKQRSKRLGERFLEKIKNELKTRASNRMISEMKKRIGELTEQRPRNAYAASNDPRYEYNRSDMQIIAGELLTECQVVESVDVESAQKILSQTSLKLLNVVFYDTGADKWIPFLIVAQPDGKKVNSQKRLT